MNRNELIDTITKRLLDAMALRDVVRSTPEADRIVDFLIAVQFGLPWIEFTKTRRDAEFLLNLVAPFWKIRAEIDQNGYSRIQFKNLATPTTMVDGEDIGKTPGLVIASFALHRYIDTLRARLEELSRPESRSIYFF